MSTGPPPPALPALPRLLVDSDASGTAAASEGLDATEKVGAEPEAIEEFAAVASASVISTRLVTS
jgi:hypothetical protein